MVEALRDIARHLQMLNLVASHRHLMRIEHQDIGSHQDRIGKQAHGDAVVGFFPFRHVLVDGRLVRSEEQTSELQSLMRITYAVFCLKKKNKKTPHVKSYK